MTAILFLSSFSAQRYYCYKVNNDAGTFVSFDLVTLIFHVYRLHSKGATTIALKCHGDRDWLITLVKD